MSVFERVHNLMKSHFERIPLEDLTTEFLAGILESNQDLLDSFVKEVLKLEGGDNFTFITQKQYILNSEPGGKAIQLRPDMVFSNGQTLCFLENKVESPEHKNQLHDYYRVLKNENPDGNYYLRYCTKYYDPKNPKDYGGQAIFYQFRWSDISEFLSYQNENLFIKQFLQFLRSHGMGQIDKFNIDDENTMIKLFPLLDKMDKMCEIILPSFKEFFGEPLRNSSSDQILFRNRYGFLSKNGVFGKASAVFVGFDFDKQRNDRAPVLQVLLWCKSENENSDSLIMDSAKKEDFRTYPWGTDGIGIAIEEPLSSFLGTENQQLKINPWFVEKIAVVKDFINGNLNLLKTVN